VFCYLFDGQIECAVFRMQPINRLIDTIYKLLSDTHITYIVHRAKSGVVVCGEHKLVLYRQKSFAGEIIAGHVSGCNEKSRTVRKSRGLE